MFGCLICDDWLWKLGGGFWVCGGFCDGWFGGFGVVLILVWFGVVVLGFVGLCGFGGIWFWGGLFGFVA